MKEDRMGFLEKHAADPVVASAILALGVSPFLWGLSPTELAMVKNKVEKHISPEIAEAKAMTQRALKDAEAGWARAIGIIAQRGGLTRGPDGDWILLIGDALL